jgi:hypothetical protein
MIKATNQFASKLKIPRQEQTKHQGTKPRGHCQQQHWPGTDSTIA